MINIKRGSRILLGIVCLFFLTTCSQIPTIKQTEAPFEEPLYEKDVVPTVSLPDTVPELIELLTKSQWEVLLATRKLGDFGSEASPAIPLLVRLLINDELIDIRESAAETLGEIGLDAKDATPALIASMLNESEFIHVRENAAIALGRIKDPSSIYALMSCMDNEKNREFPFLSIDCAEAIAEITNKKFVSGRTNDENGIPKIVYEVEAWWEEEGQYINWIALESIPKEDESLKYFDWEALGINRNHPPQVLIEGESIFDGIWMISQEGVIHYQDGIWIKYIGLPNEKIEWQYSENIERVRIKYGYVWFTHPEYSGLIRFSINDQKFERVVFQESSQRIIDFEILSKEEVLLVIRENWDESYLEKVNLSTGVKEKINLISGLFEIEEEEGELIVFGNRGIAWSENGLWKTREFDFYPEYYINYALIDDSAFIMVNDYGLIQLQDENSNYEIEKLINKPSPDGIISHPFMLITGNQSDIWVVDHNLQNTYRYDSTTGESTTIKNYFPDADLDLINYCYGFFISSENNLWLSTDKGLLIISMER